VQSDGGVRSRTRWPARAASPIAGALPALAFPEANLWPLAGIGFVPLLLLVRGAPTRREGALLAWWGGSGWLLGTQHWLFPNVGAFLPPLVLAVGALYIPWGAVAWTMLTGRVTVRSSMAAIGVLSGGWILIEFVRSWEYLGGPFGLLGASLWTSLPLLSAAALGGIWAVGYIAIGVNIAIVLALTTRKVSARAAALGFGALLLAIGPAYYYLAPAPAAQGSVRVGLVQPGVIHDAQARFDVGERLTRELIGGDVDLVVWGESSVGFDIEDRPALRVRLQELARDIDANILVNVDALSTERGSIFKSSVLISPSGIAGRYDKTRLVPFGEYVPVRPLFGWVPGITEAAEIDRSRGVGPRLLSTAGIAIGPLVCFESAFPDMSRTLVDRGAEIVVVQSSTSTFQGSWAPEAHASLAAVRAMETGRPVIHATLTGVSAAFDAQSRRLEWMPTEAVGTRIVEVALGRRTTPYSVLGDWVVIASAATCAAALARSIAPSTRAREK
jgi:apolipoprotein N-acyltransferase